MKIRFIILAVFILIPCSVETIRIQKYGCTL